MVKFAKDPWQTKETMKDLKDDNKLQALVDRNFFTKDQDPLVVEVERGCGYSMEELEEKVREALRGTSNRLAPGPDGISYRFIKLVLDTSLGREIVQEVAESLKEGRIPKAWQNSKVVFIPKLDKDHKAAKGWRPINLINCIRKLAEKVVANELQGAGYLLSHVDVISMILSLTLLNTAFFFFFFFFNSLLAYRINLWRGHGPNPYA